MIRRQRDFPRELVIGDDVWTVKFVRTCGGTDGWENVGLCDPAILTLFIKLGQTPAERFQTFVHEVFHAIEYSYQIKIEHELISKLEVPIAALFRENGIII